MAYGYRLQGGLSGYNVIDQRILNGDDGNYLIKLQPDTGYAESALTEPWACVTAAYGLKYRTGLKAGGTAWIVGTPPHPPLRQGSGSLPCRSGGLGSGDTTRSAQVSMLSHTLRECC